MKKIILTITIITTFMYSNAQVVSNPEDVSPLLIGETIPNEVLINQNNENVKLYDLIKQKPTVLVFYRGGWCPYCNLHLSALAQTEEDIIKLGYQIIAISPDDPQNLKPTITDEKINYTLLSDYKANLITKVGIGFNTPTLLKPYISKKTKGNTTAVLPVPAIFILNTKGEILFEYINPNYKQRISPELLLAVLKNLKVND